jgi:septal ring factor EnvC (AmiA/AmiB activator)
MTDSEKRQMKQFEAKVRRLISLYKDMQKENSDLYTELERKEADIERLQAELRQSQSDYKNLKLAKMIQVSDDEHHDAKMRITKLVRDVNKCINMLSVES